MAVMRELHAQLMRAASLRPDLQPGQTAMHGAALIVQQSLPGALVAALHDLDAAAVFVLAQPVLKRAGRLRRLLP